MTTCLGGILPWHDGIGTWRASRASLLPWGGKSDLRACGRRAPRPAPSPPASADRYDPVVSLALWRPDHDLVSRPVTEQRPTHG